MTLGEVRELDYPEVAEEIGKLLYGQPFQIPAQYAFLGRAVSTLVGVSTGLAPEFDFIECATPYARKFLGLNLESMRQTTQQFLSQMVQAVSTLLRLPRSLERILTKLEAGQLEMRIAGEFDVGARAFCRRERTGDTFPFALALMFVASLAGAYFLDTAHDHLLALLSLGLAAILGVRLFFRW
jgi:predicted unusual protein kinase regulating ubiquinone biosynthesis (AarF/ABC1/UbiB family)